MSRLLYANLARLMKSRIFWLIEAFLAGYSIFVYSMGAINMKNGITIGASEWSLYFFNEMLFSHIIMVFFIPFFIGVEYSDGAIRNKIMVGHKRKDIYLANFMICCIVGVIQFATYMFTSLIAGLVLIGPLAITGIKDFSWRIGYGLAIIFVYAAVFTTIAMLDTNKTRVAVVEIAIVLLFIILVSQIWSDLSEPERINRMVSTEDGTFVQEDVPNRKYVEGKKRAVYEWLDCFLPADQAMYVIDPAASYSMKIPVCLLGEAALIVGTGIYFFRKKDLK